MLRLFSAIIAFLFLSCSGTFFFPVILRLDRSIQRNGSCDKGICPIKSDNDRKGKMSGNDIVIPPSHTPAPFFPVILRLDRSILKRDNRSRRQIARSSRAMTERGKCQKMIFHPVMLRLDRGIRRNGSCGKGIARSSRTMTEREERRKMMLRGAGNDVILLSYSCTLFISVILLPHLPGAA